MTPNRVTAPKPTVPGHRHQRHGLRSRAAESARAGSAGCGSAGPEHLYNRRHIQLVLRARYRMDRNRRESVNPRAG